MNTSQEYLRRFRLGLRFTGSKLAPALTPAPSKYSGDPTQAPIKNSLVHGSSSDSDSGSYSGSNSYSGSGFGFKSVPSDADLRLGKLSQLPLQIKCFEALTPTPVPVTGKENAPAPTPTPDLAPQPWRKGRKLVFCQVARLLIDCTD